MKVKRIDDLHADAGWRTFSFLRIETTDGIIEWSEYTEADGSRGLTSIIKGLSDLVIGQDPHRIQYIMSHLASRTIQAPGGVNQRAMAAIENALLDIKGKALGVPVWNLLGGKVRDRLPVYFSHCGTYRVRNHSALGVPQLRSYDDVARLGEEVRRMGFKALKTNILALDRDEPAVLMPGFGRSAGHPELNASREVLDAVCRTLQAFRDGGGPRWAYTLIPITTSKPRAISGSPRPWSPSIWRGWSSTLGTRRGSPLCAITLPARSPLWNQWSTGAVSGLDRPGVFLHDALND